MPKVNIMSVSAGILAVLIISGVTISWLITPEESILKRDGEILAKHKWQINAERTYINKNSWYNTNVKCKAILAIGGKETATRCYYPNDYFEAMSRSLLNTQITTAGTEISKVTPYYAYGTRGAYAGILTEEFLFIDTEEEEEFPSEYRAVWQPRDTRNYQMVWKVSGLKNQPLPPGNYTQCNYEAKNIKIDLMEACKGLIRAEVNQDRIDFIFMQSTGNQAKEVKLVDPSEITYSLCYQPQANTSTECGGLGTGNYSSCLGSWGLLGLNCTNAFDNNTATYGYGLYPGDGGYFYINFTKPGTANRIGSPFWILISNNTGAASYNLSLNLTVNESCWRNPIQYYIRSNQTVSKENIEVKCYNGTDWQLFYWKNLSNAAPIIRETGQWWNITSTEEYLYLNGLQENRSYEYRKTANITTGLTYISIYDDTNRFMDVIGLGVPYYYALTLLRFHNTNQNITASGGKLNLTMDSRADVYNATLNISGKAKDIRISAHNQSKTELLFPGNLSGGELTQDKFHYNGVEYASSNISFTGAGSKAIYINFSNQGKSNRNGTFNLTFSAYESDADNALLYEEKMWNVNQSGSIYNGTFTNISKWQADNKGRYTETFANNDTYYKWETDEDSFWTLVPGENKCIYGNYYGGAYVSADGCLGVKCTGTGTGGCDQGRKISSKEYYINNISEFSLTVAMWTQHGGEAYLEFFDDSNKVQLGWSKSATAWSCGGASGCYAIIRCNMTFQKISTTQWNVTSQTWGQFSTPDYYGYPDANCPSGTVSISSLDEDYKIGIRTSNFYCGWQNTCYSYGEFYRFMINGPQINKTGNFTAGREGVGNSYHSGTYTSQIINITPTNITRATLQNVRAYIPDNTEVKYYISNNETSFEEVIPGESHLFLTKGNKLRAKFDFNSTSNLTSPIIYYYEVEVVAASINGLDIDVGSDGTIDWEYDYKINSSNTPINATGDEAINTYIFSECANQPNCLIPISLAAGSAGVVEINSIELTEDINPISLNLSDIQEQNNSNRTINFTGTYVYFSGINIDYHGNKNITVSAYNAGGVNMTNLTIAVYYSKFSSALPYTWTNSTFFEPKTINSKNVTPYGQTALKPIYNISILAYDSPGVLIAVNQSPIYSCTNISISHNNSKAAGFLMNGSIRQTHNISNTSQVYGLWMWADLNGCNVSEARLLKPNLSIESCCQGCVPCWS